MTTTAEDYLRKAQECVAQAERAQSDADKAEWLRLAEGYRQLAKHSGRWGKRDE